MLILQKTERKYYNFLWVISSLMFILSTLSACTSNTSLKSSYGATDESIAQVAKVYDISLDEINTYGPQPFPVNYITHQLNWQWDREKPVIYREQVNDLIKGYVEQCSLSNVNVLYVYYSNFEQILQDGRGPLILFTDYQIDISNSEEERDNQILSNIGWYNSRDSGGLNWDFVVKKCS